MVSDRLNYQSVNSVYYLNENKDLYGGIPRGIMSFPHATQISNKLGQSNGQPITNQIKVSLLIKIEASWSNWAWLGWGQDRLTRKKFEPGKNFTQK